MFSTVIKELRLSHHMTQKELAQILYISPGAISQYEQGKIFPSRETLDRMAKFFSVSVDYLMGTSANAELEAALNQEYCNGVMTADLLRRCMEVKGEDRAVLLRIVDALGGSGGKHRSR